MDKPKLIVDVTTMYGKIRVYDKDKRGKRMIKKYIKTTPVEAIQITKDNRKEIRKFANGYRVNFETSGNSIFTLEGRMRFNYGDYLIKNQSGQCYVCARDIFESTYKEISDD